jgi:hypothetical protein
MHGDVKMFDESRLLSPEELSSKIQQIPPGFEMIFQNLSQSSLQVIRKGDNKVIEAVRYNIIPEPSTLRPIKSWLLQIEQWSCDEILWISSRDVIAIRVIHSPLSHSVHGYSQFIKDIFACDTAVKINTENGLNALMAFILIKSKIEAGRFPDIQKILSLHQL